VLLPLTRLCNQVDLSGCKRVNLRQLWTMNCSEAMWLLLKWTYSDHKMTVVGMWHYITDYSSFSFVLRFR